MTATTERRSLRDLMTDEHNRIGKRLYDTWHELLFAPKWSELSDMDQEKWRRLARVAIAETRR